jgi:hypothetical protein
MVTCQSLLRVGIFYLTFPRGRRFLLGAVSAAVVVLTIAGASLMLSGAIGAASGEQGRYRLPRPQLSLGTPPLARPDGALS